MSNIVLSDEQQKFVDLCVQRYKDGQRITILSSPAGTGKTVTLEFITKALGFSEGDYVYTSYTGQAVRMLRKKGCNPAMTIHHMIYEMRPMPNGTFYKIKRKTLPYKIIYIDEISMVPAELLNDVMRYGIYIVAVGDAAQLPPIYKDQDNHMLDNPHWTLTKIFRQKEGNGILDLATYVRTGGDLNNLKQFDDGQNVRVLNANELSMGMLTWADEVLCATNNKRNSLNRTIRNYLNNGETGIPIEGDKIVINRNYWDLVAEDSEEDALTNGLVGNIHNLRIEEIKLPLYNKNVKFKYLIADFVDEIGKTWKDLRFDYQMFEKGEPTLSWKNNMELYKKAQYLIPVEALYGNVISTHKSQGNEWEKVLVIQEKWPTVEDEARKHLYTAVTRAKEKLVLILKD